MLVQHNNELADQLLDEMMEEIAEDREGQHPSVTDLIDCLTKTYYNTEDAGSGRLDFTRQTKMFFLIGLGLERALLVRRKETPIAGETQGIYYHADSLDKGLVEVKSTRSSVKNIEAQFPDRWMKQVKGYLGAIGERVVDISVVYLIPGEFTVYRVTFSQLEIDLHWQWLQERKEVWLRAKQDRQAPKAFAYNEDWECKTCQYKMICDTRSRMGL